LVCGRRPIDRTPHPTDVVGHARHVENRPAPALGLRDVFRDMRTGRGRGNLRADEGIYYRSRAGVSPQTRGKGRCPGRTAMNPYELLVDAPLRYKARTRFRRD